MDEDVMYIKQVDKSNFEAYYNNRKIAVIDMDYDLGYTTAHIVLAKLAKTLGVTRNSISIKYANITDWEYIFNVIDIKKMSYNINNCGVYDWENW
jgi:hypothetical protein